MSISAKQVKNILDYGTQSTPNFTAPTATFVADVPTYIETSIPGAINLTGTITPNDGVLVGWTITQGASTLSSGTGTAVSHSLVSIPTAVGSYSYTLNVNYTDSNSNLQVLNKTLTITVTATSYFGQLANPGDDIIVPGDLTPAILATFTESSKQDLVNLFDVVASNTGRIVIVVPSSYGTLYDIQDNTNSSVLSQFNVVADPGNNRTIYTSINPQTPATYKYKLVYTLIIAVPTS